MRLFDFISVKLTFVLIVGILLGHYLSIAPTPLLMLLFALSIFLGLSYRKQRPKNIPLFGILVAFTTITIGALAVSLSNPVLQSDYFGNYDLKTPKMWKVKIDEKLKPNSYSQRFIANVNAMDTSTVSGRLLVNLTIEEGEAISVDDELVFYGELETVPGPLNLHQFDYKDYLAKKGIFHQVSLKNGVLIHDKHTNKTLFGIASKFRENLVKKLKQYEFGEDELGIIQALLLGKRDDISSETFNAYRDAGAVHILAVSGLHVGIILLLLQFLLRPLEKIPKGHQLKTLVIIALLWAFAFITGLSPSIIRAVTMFSFLAYAMNLNRPTNTFNIIALSIFFILLIEPMFLFQVGFQMSYAAVIAIVWIYPKLQHLWFPQNLFLRKVWQLLSVSTAAQLGVLPLALYYFHQFPALFFLSNLIVVPFLGLILSFGILVLVLTYFDSLPAFMVQAFDFLIYSMNQVIAWVAKQEAFVFQQISFDGVQLILFYAILFSFIVLLSRPKFKNLTLFLTFTAVFSGWLLYVELKLHQKETLIVAHRTRNSIVLNQVGNQLNVYTTNAQSAENIIDKYSVAERIKEVRYDSLKNAYTFKDKNLYNLDSSGVYPTKTVDYLMLTQSPKVHLSRVIDSCKPKVIIADGSNYKSYVARWKSTCAARKIPFHYTGEKGSFSISEP